MITYSVQSNDKPEKMSYYQHGQKAEVLIRTTPVLVEDPEGDFYQYDEVYFETDEPKEAIEKNLEAFFDFGKSWDGNKPLSQAELIEKLQERTKQNAADIAYVAMMTGVDMEE